jgi:hypothetical protein
MYVRLYVVCMYVCVYESVCTPSAGKIPCIHARAYVCRMYACVCLRISLYSFCRQATLHTCTCVCMSHVCMHVSTNQFVLFHKNLNHTWHKMVAKAQEKIELTKHDDVFVVEENAQPAGTLLFLLWFHASACIRSCSCLKQRMHIFTQSTGSMANKPHLRSLHVQTHTHTHPSWPYIYTYIHRCVQACQRDM